MPQPYSLFQMQFSACCFGTLHLVSLIKIHGRYYAPMDEQLFLASQGFFIYFCFFKEELNGKNPQQISIYRQ